MLKCPHCYAPNAQTAEHCHHCATSLQPVTAVLPPAPTARPQVCPRCSSAHKLGTIRCAHCGYLFPVPAGHTRLTQLQRPEEWVTEEPEPPALANSLPARPQPLPPAGLLTENSHFQLVLSNQTCLTLSGRREYFIGRADAQNNWQPHIDLSYHSGQTGGISRRHARIFLEHGRPFVEDIGSLNGTFVNTVRLITHVPHPLHHGDELIFGKVHASVQLA